jgi:phosphoglycerate dehydrogenase-like enzyme
VRVLIHIAWPTKAWSITDEGVAELRRRFPKIEFAYARTRDEAAAMMHDVDVLFGPYINPAWLPSANQLKWVHSSAAAVEGLLPLRELAARGIVVTNSRGVQAIPIAEHVMGGLLVVARKFDRTLEAQRDRRWIQNDLVDDWPYLLHGRRMTIVGLGTIGIEVAKRAHAFGMRITAVRRRVNEPKPKFVERVMSPGDLDESLRGADVVVLSAPGTAATKNTIRAEQIALMNRGAILVNVARAAIVDQSAMVDALESGQLGGAVLDVFEKEPLDPESPLWSMPNVVLSPHSSGFRADHWDDVLDVFSDNLRRYQRGQPLKNVVDTAAGY